MAKRGDQKTVEINGTEYTLQHPGMMWIFENTDAAKGSDGVVRDAELIKSLFKNVVVKPKMNMSDLNDMESEVFGKLLKEAKSFLGTDALQ